jgi:hypothetical protein
VHKNSLLALILRLPLHDLTVKKQSL